MFGGQLRKRCLFDILSVFSESEIHFSFSPTSFKINYDFVKPFFVCFQASFSLPARHEELVLELRSLLRDHPGRSPFLHSRHGQGSPYVPAQDQLVAPGPPLLRPHPDLRRVQKVHHEISSPRQLDRTRNLLLNYFDLISLFKQNCQSFIYDRDVKRGIRTIIILMAAI